MSNGQSNTLWPWVITTLIGAFVAFGGIVTTIDAKITDRDQARIAVDDAISLRLGDVVANQRAFAERINRLERDVERLERERGKP